MLIAPNSVKQAMCSLHFRFTPVKLCILCNLSQAARAIVTNGILWFIFSSGGDLRSRPINYCLFPLAKKFCTIAHRCCQSAIFRAQTAFRFRLRKKKNNQFVVGNIDNQLVLKKGAHTYTRGEGHRQL